MFVEIRIYAGFAGQAGRLAAVRPELERLVHGVAGLHHFQLLETTEGLATLIEGATRAACEECAHRAEAWMVERMPALAGYVPVTAIGSVIAEAGEPQGAGGPRS